MQWLYCAALPLAQGPPGSLHWIALSHECEGRAAAGDELAVATLAARAMAATKEKIGRMVSLRQFVPDIDTHMSSLRRRFNTSIGLYPRLTS